MTQALWSDWLLVAAGALSTGIANVLLKKSRLVATDPGVWSLVTSPWFMAAIVLYLLDLILFAKALERLPVSIALPVFFGIMFGSVAILSSLFLAERLAANHFVALGCISAGIVIMAHKS